VKRTPFKRKPPASTKAERAAPVHYRLTVKVNMPRVTGEVVTLAKEVPVRSESYRRLVAAGPCKVCGIVGYSQAAHPNTGKGTGMKTDDRLCFALCTVHVGADGQLVQGCHEKFDQGALFTQAVRRELEPAWAADTQRQVTARGEWPKNLPKPEDEIAD
jgi:hypothetical protein